jgi:hypothetical protein
VTNLCRRCIEEHAVESIHKSQDDGLDDVTFSDKIRNLREGMAIRSHSISASSM